MNLDGVAPLAQALLYEGYLLYPYRDTAVKNRHRWMFGTLYPQSFADGQREHDPWTMQVECLVLGKADAQVDVRIRFLHLVDPPVERHVDLRSSLGPLHTAPERLAFAFETDAAMPIRGTVDMAAGRLAEGITKVTVQVSNVTPFTMPATVVSGARRDAALPFAFASAHAILGARGGEFVSLIDPPDDLRDAVACCRNVGVWPVLVGSAAARDMMLAAPIILGDYPRVAPESAGDFFDATEIDELLTLRVLTLSDGEKAAIRDGDPRAHAMLERTEALADAERHRLHGAARTLRPGTRVRITPRPGGDVFDLALAGKAATVVQTEEDYEGRVFAVVTVDDDPGRDLGIEGKPGHRFFFRPDELEILP